MSKINCEHEWGITPDQGHCCKKCGTFKVVKRHQCNLTKSLDVIRRFEYDLEYHTMKLNAAKIASKETTPND